ncbi:hypothetical protein SYJ56_23860 [Algoriphagus sp. D3-2-R+10]|uniref:hypothetical protein n=1 Tax=Algoriphagus aurantiacus TaxID=3103948 RepID=UPI002B3A035A|nr:hypothetical protein [Algoriphagus sp. D3-2-R+10]MEB2778366.1 hypothetical protein [Algoriphagus sp. D3-2-R+10]
MDEITPVPKKKINVNLLLGLSAVFLSASALIVSIFQTNILREQQFASVWPHMEQMGNFSSGSYKYVIQNKGVGPAIIKDLSYLHMGSTYESPRELFTVLFGDDVRGVGYTNLPKDYVFKSGEAITLIHINLPDSMVRRMTNRLESDSMNLKITYADVYGNCWMLDNYVTTRLSKCPN